MQKRTRKSLLASMARVEKEGRKIRLENWLKTQPGSTRRGVARGTFKLPDYILE